MSLTDAKINEIIGNISVSEALETTQREAEAYSRVLVDSVVDPDDTPEEALTSLGELFLIMGLDDDDEDEDTPTVNEAIRLARKKHQTGE